LCSPAGEFRSKPSRLRYLYIAMDFYIECTIVYCLLDSAFLLIVAYHILVTDFYKMFIDTKPGEHTPGRAPRLLLPLSIGATLWRETVKNDCGERVVQWGGGRKWRHGWRSMCGELDMEEHVGKLQMSISFQGWHWRRRSRHTAAKP
jgi:hypothetical protein